MPDCSQRLADVLKKYRIGLGLTQDGLAEKSHIDARSILNMEMGRGNPQLKTLFSLIRSLHIDARELFEDDLPEEPLPIRQLHQLVAGCTEDEAATLLPVVEAVLAALRSKQSIKVE